MFLWVLFIVTVVIIIIKCRKIHFRYFSVFCTSMLVLQPKDLLWIFLYLKDLFEMKSICLSYFSNKCNIVRVENIDFT